MFLSSKWSCGEFFWTCSFKKNNSQSATHSTSKTEKQTFEAKTASTFYMVVSNKALIPYNMHTWNMILQKCCSRCITHLPHNAVVGEEWDAFVCAAGFVHYFKLSLNFTYYHHITARYTLRQRIYLIKKHGGGIYLTSKPSAPKWKKQPMSGNFGIATL